MIRLTILLFFCVFSFSTVASAQGNKNNDRSEKVESAKIAYLTDKMELTAEQAQKFWPVYNEYQNKRRDIVNAYRSGYRQNVEELTEQQARVRINELFQVREKELALEQEYAARYQRIISNRQLIKLYRGERDFTKLLLKRLDESRANN